MLAQLQRCPRCEGAIHREHGSSEPVTNGEITYLYCEFCGMGWETWWERGTDGALHERLTATYESRLRPVELGKFLQRLESARAA